MKNAQHIKSLITCYKGLTFCFVIQLFKQKERCKILRTETKKEKAQLLHNFVEQPQFGESCRWTQTPATGIFGKKTNKQAKLHMTLFDRFSFQLNELKCNQMKQKHAFLFPEKTWEDPVPFMWDFQSNLKQTLSWAPSVHFYKILLTKTNMKQLGNIPPVIDYNFQTSPE